MINYSNLIKTKTNISPKTILEIGSMHGHDANTLKNEPDATGHVYDDKLEQYRIKNGLSKVPYNIIPTLDGMDIDFNHIEFTSGEVPIIIYTTQVGYEYLKQNLLLKHQLKLVRHQLQIQVLILLWKFQIYHQLMVLLIMY